MFEIELTYNALQDLTVLRKFEQQIIVNRIYEQLRFEPTVETPNRKQLQPNNIADWELRRGKYRVFYDVEDQVKIVAIRAVGVKIGNELYIRGKKRTL